MEKGPIFIGGLAHSGKTPLRLMLSAHPNIAMTRRTRMWDRFYDQFGELSRPANFERCLTAMLESKHIRVLQPDPDRLRREFRQGPPSYARLFALFHTHHAERLGKARWGDQLGFVERFADPIFAAFPTAKMIHMIRDPRDRYRDVKCTTQGRRGKVGWATARWIYSADLTQRNKQRYPANYKVMRYESLVSRPEETLREICDFLDEVFVPRMLPDEGAAPAGDEGEREGYTAVVPKAPHPSLSKQEVAFTQAYARRQMRAFDYPLASTQFSLRERLLFYLVDWPANRAGMAAWDTLRARSAARHLENESL